MASATSTPAWSRSCAASRSTGRTCGPDANAFPVAAAPLVHAAEFLRALARVDFARINVAGGVDRDVVHPVELARVAAVAPERAHLATRFALDDVHFVVRSVSNEKPALVRVRRRHHIPRRARAQ